MKDRNRDWCSSQQNARLENVKASAKWFFAMPRAILFPVFVVVVLAISATSVPAADAYFIGFGKRDATPSVPLRLSGYATRSKPFDSVADALHARAMVISPADSASQSTVDPRTVVLVSVDSILVTSEMSVEIASWLQTQYALPRQQMVLSATHSHAAPHVAGGLSNLYQQPLSESETAATLQNTRQLISAIKSAIAQAMESRQPASLHVGEGSADFAVNRRVLKNGSWSGFGEQSDGAVDHRVRVLRAISSDETLLGAAFMYACHATTLGGDFNQVSADWPGLAASRLEAIHAGAVFLPVIGCGADQNPNPRGTYELAQQHSAKLVDAIEPVLAQANLLSITSVPIARFGYAGLAPEQPTEEKLNTLERSDRANDRRWSEYMKTVRKEMGRLPETYPMPIHTWQFGDQWTWVFLGGEVVVDYQEQIEKELPTQQTWVAAYCDDVFAYVASEAMRAQGGYEVDGSMIYYLQPGRWQTGTQSLIARRVAEIFQNQLTESEPLRAADALAAVRVPEGYQVDLVAGEPLVQDPINLAFGADGSVWVVEMSDYPRGVEGGGRVKRLRDTDRDGKLDEAVVFLEGLSYPTSVATWRDGVLIIAAPDIIFASDRDGDGKADLQETWVTGINEANPQHRANGFEWGLDGWLHFGAGDGTRELKSVKNGKTYSVSHKDVAWHPATGEIKTTSGETQFVRARDSFGNWFGNSNSHPIYQYVIEDRYLSEDSVSGGPRHDLLDPPIAPPVYPSSQTMDRFNDLFALNRFTSACSSIVCRVPGMTTDDSEALICEPVHNLVARIALRRSGSNFTAVRHPGDGQYDFFTSSDPWSRPVRAVNAPDGTIWIVDMARKVIEHPEWIPTAWQERIDLRAGSQLGRIYRVYRSDFKPTALPILSDSLAEILHTLTSENGALREHALQVIMQDASLDVEAEVRELALTHQSAAVRAASLGCLAGQNWLTQKDIVHALNDASSNVVRYALELSERLGELDSETLTAIAQVPEAKRGAAVDLQWVLTCNMLSGLDASQGLRQIAARSTHDAWINRGLSLIRDSNQAAAVTEGLLLRWDGNKEVTPSDFMVARTSLQRLWSRMSEQSRRQLASTRLEQLQSTGNVNFSASDLLLITVLAEQGKELVDPKLLTAVTNRARARMLDDDAPLQERLALLNLIGSGLQTQEADLEAAESLLSSSNSASLQQAVLETLRRLDAVEISTSILDNWTRLGSGARRSACATLLSRPQWVAALVRHLENGEIAARELDPASIQQLRSYQDRSLRTRCLTVFGQPTDRSVVVEQYLSKMPAPRLSDLGQKLFEENCAACHVAKEGQPMIGSPLENLKHWTIDQWLTGILDPNRNVEPKFMQSTILTADDQVFVGIVLERTPSATRLAQADGTIRSVPTSDVLQIRESQTSLMPEGFEEKLSPEQIAELLGYLRSH